MQENPVTKTLYSFVYFTGNENYDWDAFENGADYKGGYSSSDPTIRLFWEVFHELPESEKKKFLLFLTGCDRIPIQGMKAIKVFIILFRNINTLVELISLAK